ncbi:MAG: hypothetical protein NTX65_08315 [Ignavibacteriales bacterium]|nr:hypothetical protein [Ignavibacteriales bacterium]
MAQLKNVSVAVIDLYNNEPNRDIQYIKNILNQCDSLFNQVRIDYNIYDTRHTGVAPDSAYDIYISSGGPGSPWDGAGSSWEAKYFSLLDSLWNHNQNNSNKKYFFFICHSFQLMVRYFRLGEVIKRNSESFGVMPIYKTESGSKDILLKSLPDPFYSVDSRSWQAIQPNNKMFGELGAQILCLEKERPHIPLERAMMAIRISNEFVGTQFHPEVDAVSMHNDFCKDERKKEIVSKYGGNKYYEILNLLEQSAGVELTQKTVIPNFLKHAIEELRPE